VRSHSRTMDEAREKAKTLTLAGAAMNITCPIYIVAGELDPIVNATGTASRSSTTKTRPVIAIIRRLPARGVPARRATGSRPR